MEKKFDKQEFEEVLNSLYEFVKDDIAELQKYFEEKKKQESKTELEQAKQKENESDTGIQGHIEMIGSFGSALDKLMYLHSLDKTCALRREYFSPDTFILIDEMRVSNLEIASSPILVIFYTDEEGNQHAEPFIPDYEDLFAEDWSIIIKD